MNLSTILKKGLGIICMVVGMLGLFLPFLPGIVLVIVGANLLDDKRLQKCIQKLQAKIKPTR